MTVLIISLGAITIMVVAFRIGHWSGYEDGYVAGHNAAQDEECLRKALEARTGVPIPSAGRMHLQ